MKKKELIEKSREAMLAAVQSYNNPQITFKSENFIVLAIISWTYLLHCYYANQGIDYRYFHYKGKKKIYDKTTYGAYKHWELERCLNDKKSPLDIETTKNLKFLIGLRHEIEHQMTQNIDDTISAKIQACSINYNYYLKDFFGTEYGIDNQLGILRKYMFDNKKPTWLYGMGIGMVTEVLHMLMIFFTNMDDAVNAFEFVKICTLPKENYH